MQTCAIALLSFAATALAAQVPLTMLTDTKAKCLDGTLAGFYAHCLHDPTIDECIVIATGMGWPASTIPAVARWLGFANEGGLEDALAEGIRLNPRS